MSKKTAGYDKKTAKAFYKESVYLKNKNKVTEKRFLDLINFPLKNKVALDAGCGLGDYVSLLNKMGAKVFIDSSRQMINIAKSKYSNISKFFLVKNVVNLPFKKNYFDFIISKYVLHYLDNPDDAFKEFFRCLKKNGVLIFSVHHPTSSMFFKKNKNYFKKEKIKVSIMEGVKVIQTTHLFTDYLSEYFLKHFKLEKIKEGRGKVVLFPNIKIPEYLLIKARKK